MPGDTLWLVSPMYFDVVSYLRVRENVRAAFAGSSELKLQFVVVDDSAGADPAVRQLEKQPDQLVITPPFSLGHQRGLVFGLRRLSSLVRESDLIVTLDADGEDKPEDLPRLLAPHLEDGASLRTIAVAARTRRRESVPFKLLYLVFKLFFHLLTGTVIRSGNYASFRGWLTSDALFHPHFDLCYSSSLLSLGLKVQPVPCERGPRYAGKSKMTYVKLIQHGLRMLMPFADRIATRGLVILACLLAMSLVGAAVLVGLELAGSLASPPWLLYAFCTATLLFALAAGCLAILFALVVQTQSLSLAQLDRGLRKVEADGALDSARRALHGLVPEQEASAGPKVVRQ